jgi:hypothetical protein
MPRKITWRPRLPDMHRQVQDSPRPLYTRSDLERLFRLGPDATLKLLQLMPRAEQAGALIVEREELLAWLNACVDAEDLRAHLDAIARKPPKPSRRRLQLALPASFRPEQPLTPHEIYVKRGVVEIRFSTLKDLGDKLLMLLKVFETDAFERRYCEPEPEAPRTQRQVDESNDAAFARAHNRFFDAVHAMQKIVPSAPDFWSQSALQHKARRRAFAELAQLRDQHGYEIPDCIIAANERLDAPRHPPPAVVLQTASPALSSPPVVAPLQPPAHEDRCASSSGPCAPAIG